MGHGTDNSLCATLLNMNPFSLILPTFYLRLALSFFLVAFGQPSFIPSLGWLTAILGFALFWSILLEVPSAKKRFILGASWYFAVQIVHLSWMLSHPFHYIYIAMPLIALIYGVHSGVVSLFITQEQIKRPLFAPFIASLWTLLELSRLWILSGSSWNPAGLFLAASPYSLQMAWLAGIYGLSFWVIFTNAFVLQLYTRSKRSLISLTSTLLVIALPYLIGASLFHFHGNNKDSSARSLNVLLVQPFFPIEEWLPQKTAREAIDMAFMEWHKLFELISPYHGRSIDLVVFPENVVPFGAYAPLFRHDEVQFLFKHYLGKESLASLPSLKAPLAHAVETFQGTVWVVSHSYILQGLANWMQAGVIAGLEDRCTQDGKTCNTTSAFYFKPEEMKQAGVIGKYDKRLLVPGEYIPLGLGSFLQGYGIHDAFTPGKSAQIFTCQGHPFGVSICYEETYGHLMRENRNLGALLLINLTNDGWYPDSRLADQHFEHARLRTVEMGIPLARSTNTGVTATIDHFGRVIDRLDDETKPGVLLSHIPLEHHTTWYARTGDWSIALLSLLLVIVYFIDKNTFKKNS